MRYCEKIMEGKSDGHCDGLATTGSDFCWEHRLEHSQARISQLLLHLAESNKIIDDMVEQTKRHMKEIAIMEKALEEIRLHKQEVRVYNLCTLGADIANKALHSLDRPSIETFQTTRITFPEDHAMEYPSKWDRKDL